MIVERVLLGDRAERLHVARVAEHVHRQDPARARRDGRLDGRRVEHERLGIDVGEDGRRALVEHHVGRGHERDRRRDDLVARPMPAARTSRCRPAVPLETVTACSQPQKAANSLLEVARVRAEPEDARAQRGEHVLLLARPDVGPRERNLARRLDVHALAGVAAG